MYNGKHCPRGYSCIFLIGPAGNSACRAEKSIEWGQEQEKQEIMKKDHLILLAFLQRLMLGKKSLPKMKVMLRHNKHLYILFWWHEKKTLPKSPQLKKLTWNYPYRQYICVSQTENKGSIKKKEWSYLWTLQIAFPIVTSRLLPVSRFAPVMVSMVFPDFGPNVGKMSLITGSYR